LLSFGDKGDSVKEIKRNLALLGYLPDRDNDIFDAITRETLSQFQREHGLLVTGVATFLTQAKIYYLVNKQMNISEPWVRKGYSPTEPLERT
jgi:peptidoglycan hydrolase-like protein with peptidoglycan-binding domain